ncbi:hypothetical protein AB0395_28450 [Streptosporangium sp. NPDC051023]|uniref:hypothetical protein n=1 Tax=Streptosporangium sp. NPDC051023 TaxID=3155410 RepID=UPI00344EDB8A
MRIVFHGSWAELSACGLLDLTDAPIPPRLVLVNLQLCKDPYGDAYRLHADILDPHWKEAP